MPHRPEIYKLYAKIKDQKLPEVQHELEKKVYEVPQAAYGQLKHFLKEILVDFYRKWVIKLNLINLKVTPFDDKAVLKARKQQIIKQFKIYSTIDIQTPNRTALRESIINKLYGTGAPLKERKAFVVIGLPGSGKSSSVENRLVEEYQALKVDYDEAKPLLPEYGKQGTGNYIVYEEAKFIADRILDKVVENNDNVVISDPGLDIDYTLKHIDLLIEHEYEVHLKFVYSSPEKAAHRAIERFKKNGRFTDPVLHFTMGNKPLENYKTLITDHRDKLTSYEAYSTDAPGHKEPVLLDDLPEPTNLIDLAREELEKLIIPEEKSG